MCLPLKYHFNQFTTTSSVKVSQGSSLRRVLQKEASHSDGTIVACRRSRLIISLYLLIRVLRTNEHLIENTVGHRVVLNAECGGL
jgi:hypothetical protein